MASHDAGQIERDGRLSPGKDKLEETEGFMDGPPTPLAMNLTRSTSLI